MRLLCSETNPNISPAAALTITAAVLKQSLIPQKSQRLSGNKRGGFRSNSTLLHPFRSHLRSGLAAPGKRSAKKSHLQKLDIYRCKCIQETEWRAKKQPSALHTVSLWSRHLIVDWAFRELNELSSRKNAKKRRRLRVQRASCHVLTPTDKNKSFLTIRI